VAGRVYGSPGKDLVNPGEAQGLKRDKNTKKPKEKRRPTKKKTEKKNLLKPNRRKSGGRKPWKGNLPQKKAEVT